VTATSPELTVMACQHAAPSVAPTGGAFLARISDDALYGLGLFAIIAALLAYVTSLSFLSS
jgi:hypothetical protein